ncbi:MAG: hypothetical protein A2Y14_02410 [Verrucomicrobia bacterium GWF2_51_19]|nr:MAG: hypothetical protein A2Y14_02410 [Verrucomicrobia bacterium GWF2_51_19]
MRFSLRRLATGKDFFEKKSLPDPLSKKLLKRNTKMHAFLYFAKKLEKPDGSPCRYGRIVLAPSRIFASIFNAAKGRFKMRL